MRSSWTLTSRPTPCRYRRRRTSARRSGYLVLHGGDVAADRGEALRDVRVTPVDVVAVRDHRLALGGQSRQDEGGTAAQVVRHDITAAQRRRPVGDGDVIVDLDLATHLVQLRHQAVAA